jgi:hypothetical protein
MGAENLVFTRIRSPDRPFRSQSLYRLSCPVQQDMYILVFTARSVLNNWESSPEFVCLQRKAGAPGSLCFGLVLSKLLRSNVVGIPCTGPPSDSFPRA